MAAVCLSGHPHPHGVNRTMGIFVKDRRNSPLEKLGARWGRRKYQHFGFDSPEAMVENEVIIMKAARDLYTFVPSVINHDKTSQKIYVEKVDGRTIDKYIRESQDFSVIEKLRTALTNLHSREVVIQSDIINEQGVKPQIRGYIQLYNLEASNFLVDNQGNVWILNFEEASVKEQKYTNDDKKELNHLIQDLLSKYQQSEAAPAALNNMPL